METKWVSLLMLLISAISIRVALADEAEADQPPRNEVHLGGGYYFNQDFVNKISSHGGQGAGSFIFRRRDVEYDLDVTAGGVYRSVGSSRPVGSIRYNEVVATERPWLAVNIGASLFLDPSAVTEDTHVGVRFGNASRSLSVDALVGGDGDLESHAAGPHVGGRLTGVVDVAGGRATLGSFIKGDTNFQKHVEKNDAVLREQARDERAALATGVPFVRSRAGLEQNQVKHGWDFVGGLFAVVRLPKRLELNAVGTYVQDAYCMQAKPVIPSAALGPQNTLTHVSDKVLSGMVYLTYSPK
ncbi:MAG: hypothetical protein ACXVBW_00835 [Bdellovibrionota bacterium]